MIIMDNTTVRTNRNIDTGFFVILISGFCNFNQGGCLPTSDSFLLSCDADRTAADSDFYEICTSLCQKTEAIAIHHVSCSYFNRITIIFTNIINGNLLPFGETFGTVNAKSICSCFQKCRNTFPVISGIDSCTHHIAF